MDPRAERLPRLERVRERELKPLQQRYKDLVQLDHRDGFAEALVSAVAEDELVVALHGVQVVGGGLVAGGGGGGGGGGAKEPALGPEAVRVGAEEGGGVVDAVGGVAGEAGKGISVKGLRERGALIGGSLRERAGRLHTRWWCLRGRSSLRLYLLRLEPNGIVSTPSLELALKRLTSLASNPAIGGYHRNP